MLRQAERFSAVLEIATLLSSVRDVDALLRTVMDRLSSLLQAEAATLFMLDAEKQELWSRVLRGGGLDEIRLPLGTGIAGHVMATGQSLLLGDAYTDSHFHPNIDRMSRLRHQVDDRRPAEARERPHPRGGGGAEPQDQRLHRRGPGAGGGGGDADRRGAGQRAALRGAPRPERGAAQGQVRPVERARRPGPPLRDREGGLLRREAERPDGRSSSPAWRPRSGRPRRRSSSPIQGSSRARCTSRASGTRSPSP